MQFRQRLLELVFLLLRDPCFFFKKLKRRIILFLPMPYHPRAKKINNVLFRFDAPSLSNKEMYYEVYEEEVIEAMRKQLKPGDVFIDVGANIGYLSAQALALVGPAGQVHSFEPVPEFFGKLKTLKQDNPNYSLTINPLAAGDRKGSSLLYVTKVANIGWNTMVPGFMVPEEIKFKMEASMIRLDEYFEEKSLTKISLIKIDTEGFEYPVLKGLSRFFESGKRPPILCEIAPQAYPLLGVTLEDLKAYMESYRYQAFWLFKPHSRCDIRQIQTTSNVLFEAH